MSGVRALFGHPLDWLHISNSGYANKSSDVCQILTNQSPPLRMEGLWISSPEIQTHLCMSGGCPEAGHPSMPPVTNNCNHCGTIFDQLIVDDNVVLDKSERTNKDLWQHIRKFHMALQWSQLLTEFAHHLRSRTDAANDPLSAVRCASLFEKNHSPAC